MLEDAPHACSAAILAAGEMRSTEEDALKTSVWNKTDVLLPAIGQTVIAWWGPSAVASSAYHDDGKWGPPGNSGVRYLVAPILWTRNLYVEAVSGALRATL